MGTDNSLYVDLHVHTPISEDWRGGHENDDYISILRDAQKNSIKIIGISDHNSVRGYKRLIQIKNDNNALLTLMRQRKSINTEEIKCIEEEIILFNNVKILMAIEVNAYPGVHYIIVFNNDHISPDDVEKFLLDLSGNNQDAINGNCEFMYRIDSNTLINKFKNRFLDNCFIYAPHADSSSGIINDFDSFRKERLHILQNNNLLCIGFNKRDTKDYVITNLLPNLGTKRSVKLQFIQDSDYHGRTGERVGSAFFLIDRTADSTYNQVLKSLLSRKGVTTFSEIAEQLCNNFKKDKIIFPLNFSLQDEKISDDLKNTFCETVCALLNSEKGLIQFEVDTHASKDTKKDIDKIINNFITILKTNLNYVPGSGNITHFPASKTREYVFLNFQHLKGLFYITIFAIC